MTLLEQLQKYHKPTYEHSLRVAKYSKEIASLENLSEDSAYQGGLFHDIGKMLVENSLLGLKKIEEKQYSEIKKHVKYGYDLLINENPYLACIAGKHHPEYAVEEWPEQYSSADRQITSEYIKIVTFADFFDALMTRNNCAYKVDKENKTEVFTMLKEYFPEREEWMEKLWKAKEQE